MAQEMRQDALSFAETDVEKRFELATCWQCVRDSEAVRGKTFWCGRVAGCAAGGAVTVRLCQFWNPSVSLFLRATRGSHSAAFEDEVHVYLPLVLT